MNEKISVIIPLYNKEKEIKRTINSVLSQTFQNFEVIIVDDHSSDGGPEIVKSYKDPRISLIKQDHHGVSYTRNHGVDLVKSDYIAFLDADDEWMPMHLETILKLIEKYPYAGLYTTAWKRHTTSGETMWANYQYIPNPPWEGIIPDYFKSATFGDSPVNASGVVIPKEIFLDIGGFNEGYWYGEDTDLFGRIALKHPVAFSFEFGTIIHEDAQNRACNKRVPLDYQEPFIKTARIALIKGDLSKDIKTSLNEFIWRKEIWRAIHNMRVGKTDEAQNILKQCKTTGHYIETTTWLLLAKLPFPLFLFIREMRRKCINLLGKIHS